MRKLILLIVCGVLFSCAESENTSLKKNKTLAPLQIEIDNKDNLEKFGGEINGQLEKFNIGKSINGKTNHTLSKDAILNKEFINVSGFDDNGNAVVYRQEVVTENSGDKTIVTFVSNGIGEKCEGVNCSHCVIKEGGGCKCNQAGDPSPTNPSYCNHTVETDPPGEGIE